MSERAVGKVNSDVVPPLELAHDGAEWGRPIHQPPFGPGEVAIEVRVVPARGYGSLHNPLTLLARQAAIALVVPPLVFRNDGRGLHDVLAGTATVTMDTYRRLTTTGV